MTAPKPKQTAKFSKGQRVRVSDKCMLSEFVGAEFTVRRVFWEETGEANRKTCPSGFVCETDAMLLSDGQRRCFWERLLEKV
jgi:hypothetical protein